MSHLQKRRERPRDLAKDDSDWITLQSEKPILSCHKSFQEDHPNLVLGGSYSYESKSGERKSMMTVELAIPLEILPEYIKYINSSLTEYIKQPGLLCRSYLSVHDENTDKKYKPKPAASKFCDYLSGVFPKIMKILMEDKDWEYATKYESNNVKSPKRPYSLKSELLNNWREGPNYSQLFSTFEDMENSDLEHAYFFSTLDLPNLSSRLKENNVIFNSLLSVSGNGLCEIQVQSNHHYWNELLAWGFVVKHDNEKNHKAVIKDHSIHTEGSKVDVESYRRFVETICGRGTQEVKMIDLMSKIFSVAFEHGHQLEYFLKHGVFRRIHPKIGIPMFSVISRSEEKDEDLDDEENEDDNRKKRSRSTRSSSTPMNGSDRIQPPPLLVDLSGIGVGAIVTIEIERGKKGQAVVTSDEQEGGKFRVLIASGNLKGREATCHKSCFTSVNRKVFQMEEIVNCYKFTIDTHNQISKTIPEEVLLKASYAGGYGDKNSHMYHFEEIMPGWSKIGVMECSSEDQKLICDVQKDSNRPDALTFSSFKDCFLIWPTTCLSSRGEGLRTYSFDDEEEDGELLGFELIDV